jgi:hypothetical protein
MNFKTFDEWRKENGKKIYKNTSDILEAWKATEKEIDQNKEELEKVKEKGYAFIKQDGTVTTELPPWEESEDEVVETDWKPLKGPKEDIYEELDEPAPIFNEPASTEKEEIIETPKGEIKEATATLQVPNPHITTPSKEVIEKSNEQFIPEISPPEPIPLPESIAESLPPTEPIELPPMVFPSPKWPLEEVNEDNQEKYLKAAKTGLVPASKMSSQQHAYACNGYIDLTEKQWLGMKGVGKKLAQRLIESGPYRTDKDLLEVKGVGKGIVEQAKALMIPTLEKSDEN